MFALDQAGSSLPAPNRVFALEPLCLHRWFEASAQRIPERTFALVQRLHWLLLVISLITVAGAVAGSHGGMS
jgi:hypothetical protein